MISEQVDGEGEILQGSHGQGRGCRHQFGRLPLNTGRDDERTDQKIDKDVSQQYIQIRYEAIIYSDSQNDIWETIYRTISKFGTKIANQHATLPRIQILQICEKEI